MMDTNWTLNISDWSKSKKKKISYEIAEWNGKNG